MYLDDTTTQHVGTAGFELPRYRRRRLLRRLERRRLLPVRPHRCADAEPARSARRPHLRRGRRGAMTATATSSAASRPLPSGAAPSPAASRSTCSGAATPRRERSTMWSASSRASKSTTPLYPATGPHRPSTYSYTDLGREKVNLTTFEQHFAELVVRGRHRRPGRRRARSRPRSAARTARNEILPGGTGRHQPTASNHDSGPSRAMQHARQPDAARRSNPARLRQHRAATSSPRSRTSSGQAEDVGSIRRIAGAAVPRSGRPRAVAQRRGPLGRTTRVRARSGPTRAAGSTSASPTIVPPPRHLFPRDVRAANLSERFDKTGGFGNITDPRNLTGAIPATTLPAHGVYHGFGRQSRGQAGGSRHLHRGRGGPAGLHSRLLGQRRLVQDRDRRCDQHGRHAIGASTAASRTRTQEFCDLITLADGSTATPQARQLLSVRSSATSTSTWRPRRVEGVDAEASYNTGVATSSAATNRVSLRVLASWLLERSDTGSTGGGQPFDDFAGVASARCPIADFKAHREPELQQRRLLRPGPGAAHRRSAAGRTPAPARARCRRRVYYRGQPRPAVTYFDIRLGYDFEHRRLGRSRFRPSTTNLFDGDPPTPSYVGLVRARGAHSASTTSSGGATPSGEVRM